MLIGLIDPWHAAFVQVSTPKYLPGWDCGSCPNGGGALVVAGGASLEGGRVCGLPCCAVTVIANRRIAIGVVRRIARHQSAPWPTSHRQYRTLSPSRVVAESAFPSVVDRRSSRTHIWILRPELRRESHQSVCNAPR